MKDELIKEILTRDLKNISKENFNEKIFSKLNTSKKKEKTILFKESDVVIVFVIVFLFVFIVNLDIFPKLNQTEVLIGSIICITPIFFIAYNKIYQSIKL